MRMCPTQKMIATPTLAMYRIISQSNMPVVQLLYAARVRFPCPVPSLILGPPCPWPMPLAN